MAAPRNNAYAVASGAGVYAGRAAPSGLPSWLPAEGQFADISLNTLLSARPTGWPTTEGAGPFANWSGGVWAPDFGSMGGYVVHGSGHLTPGTPTWAGVWVFDIASQLWVGRNVPPAPLNEVGGIYPRADYYNDYFESIVSGLEGHTYPPHTYDGLAYQSSANGGGADGSLIRFAMPGSGVANAKVAHRFDLSSASAAPTRVMAAVNSISNSYPATAVDEARGGVWTTDANGLGGVGFVDFDTWTETRWTGVAFNAYGDQSIVYVPTRDCLVALGRDGPGGSNMSVRVCPIVGGVPQGWSTVAQSGTPPTDRRCGGVWSTLLGCLVSFESTGSYAVHKLTVPSDLTGGTWAWTTETMTGVSGATPSQSTTSGNGAWSRFVEAPELGCFLWADSVTGPLQAWRLTGM